MHLAKGTLDSWNSSLQVKIHSAKISLEKSSGSMRECSANHREQQAQGCAQSSGNHWRLSFLSGYTYVKSWPGVFFWDDYLWLHCDFGTAEDRACIAMPCETLQRLVSLAKVVPARNKPSENGMQLHLSQAWCFLEPRAWGCCGAKQETANDGL